MDDLERVREAKRKLAGIVANVSEVRGVGITVKGGTHAVEVLLTREPRDAAAIPGDIDGVPVVRRVVGTVSKRTPP